MAVKPTTTPPDPFPIDTPPSGAELAYEGDYVAATEYQDGDVVVKDGIAYICVGGPTTVAPDPTPWGAAALTKTNYGTSLPSSPVDGQEAILVDSLTNPSYQWRFRYNAGSTSPYKWEFIGGAAAHHYIQASEQTSSTAAADLATLGPLIVVPRSGEYDVTCNAYPIATTPTDNWFAPVVGVFDNGVSTNLQLVTMTHQTVPYHTVYNSSRLIVVAGHTLKMMYYCAGITGTQARVTIGERHMFVTPVRVS